MQFFRNIIFQENKPKIFDNQHRKMTLACIVTYFPLHDLSFFNTTHSN